jgi:hypothetical protein
VGRTAIGCALPGNPATAGTVCLVPRPRPPELPRAAARMTREDAGFVVAQARDRTAGHEQTAASQQRAGRQYAPKDQKTPTSSSFTAITPRSSNM